MERLSNIVELRKHLAERLPHARLFQPEAPARLSSRWPTGLAQVDALLHGGLPKSGITEAVVSQPGCGGALLIASLIEQARRQRQWTGLIDGADCFDPASVSADCHARLLWARCAQARQALQAADLLLRDGNLPLVILDLGITPLAELRRISSSVWHRFQRILEGGSATLVAVTPVSIVSRAQVRFSLEQRFASDALSQARGALSARLQVEVRRDLNYESPLLERSA